MPLMAAGFAALVLSAAYLAGFPAASLTYYANVAMHPVLGIVLSAAAILRWRRLLPQWTPARIITTVAALTALTTGCVLLATGATRPFYALVVAHVASSSVAALLIATLLWPVIRRIPMRAWRRSATLAVLAIFLVAVVAAIERSGREAARREAYRIVNPEAPPATMNEEGRGPDSPFFPSSADTNTHGTIPATFFLTSDTCGRCHQQIYEQWQSSMHHFSSFNNQWYRKSIEYMQDVVGTRPSKWCAGCHDHAVFFNGRFDRPIRQQIDTVEAQAGLACTSCHAITAVHGTMGQGGFDVEYPPLHDIAATSNPLLRAAHDKLLELAPLPHRETFLKPFHREQTAEFCSTCHKVHLDVPVNAYRWFRGFDDYDNWQASGVSGQGARSFYYPPKPQHCADCHMPLVPSSDPAAINGVAHSHRFAAANTAVPFVNHDGAQLQAVQDFLRSGAISVDVFGISRAEPRTAITGGRVDAEAEAATTFGIGEESTSFGARQAVIAPPAEIAGPFGSQPVAVHPGDSVRLEVVVRTRKVGHFFPAGTVDAFDVWLDVAAVDEAGREVFHSGALQPDGNVDPGAHFYRNLLLDEHGNRINKRNVWSARSVAYVRLIPPGAADTAHYRFDVPRNVRGRVTITARVRYRKFSWWNTQWAYAGVRDPAHANPSITAAHDDGEWVFTGDTSNVSGAVKAVPDLPITDMAVAQASLDVIDRGETLPSVRLGATDRERWNDYGIGLLLQGDLKGAEAAFLKVTQIEPGYADGWVNIGRARLQQGDVEGAQQALNTALERDAGLAKTHYFLALALKSLGRYDEALVHLHRAASQYPRDRVVLNQIGRVHFLQRRFPDAVAAFRKVLAIDPEDVQAHYNLMLCYQGLGDEAGAARERMFYSRFKADESADAITGDFRLLNPHDNLERQQIHEHGSALAGVSAAGTR